MAVLNGGCGLPLDLVKQELGGARARARVRLLDCCFSGRAGSATADPAGLLLGQPCRWAATTRAKRGG